MQVTWLTSGEIAIKEGKPVSHFASARYRICIPAIELSRQGVTSHLLSLPHVPDVHEAARAIAGDILVVSKSLDARTELIVEVAKSRGIPIVVDFCDNHFDHPALGSHYERLAELADAIVVNTPAMNRVIEWVTGRAAVVVVDPYEGPRGVPRFAPPVGTLRMVWFGNVVHAELLLRFLRAMAPLESLARAIEFELVTELTSSFLAQVDTLRARLAQHGVRLITTAWSISSTWNALAAADLAVIPSEDSDEARVKSPNRLIESLWAGRAVAAYPLPAYKEFAAWTYLAKDLNQAIGKLLINSSAAVENQIAQAQTYIEHHYSPVVAAQQWRAVFEQVSRNSFKLGKGNKAT